MIGFNKLVRAKRRRQSVKIQLALNQFVIGNDEKNGTFNSCITGNNDQNKMMKNVSSKGVEKIIITQQFSICILLLLHLLQQNYVTWKFEPGRMSNLW